MDKKTAKTTVAETRAPIDVNGIMARLPHRYPMLMIDRVVDLIPGEGATGIKNVSINEHFFQGHFPMRPIMPGVLIVEAMAQTAAIVVVDFLMDTDAKADLVYFMTIETARFRKPVEPGDVLQLRVQKERARGNVWRFRGAGYVGETLCAEAVFTAMLVRGDDMKMDGAA